MHRKAAAVDAAKSDAKENAGDSARDGCGANKGGFPTSCIVHVHRCDDAVRHNRRTMGGNDRVSPARHFVARWVRGRFRRGLIGCRSSRLVGLDCRSNGQSPSELRQMRTKDDEYIAALNSRPPQALIPCRSEIAIDDGPIRLSFSCLEFADGLRRPARCCGALDPSPSNSSGILQIVRTKNQISQMAQIRVGTGRIRGMAQTVQKSARFGQRCIVLNRHSVHVRSQTVLGQRYCDHTPQQ